MTPVLRARYDKEELRVMVRSGLRSGDHALDLNVLLQVLEGLIPLAAGLCDAAPDSVTLQHPHAALRANNALQYLRDRRQLLEGHP